MNDATPPASPSLATHEPVRLDDLRDGDRVIAEYSRIRAVPAGWPDQDPDVVLTRHENVDGVTAVTNEGPVLLTYRRNSGQGRPLRTVWKLRACMTRPGQLTIWRRRI